MRTRPVPTELLYAEWKRKQQQQTSEHNDKPLINHLANIASSPALLASSNTPTPSARLNRVKEIMSFKYQSSDDETESRATSMTGASPSLVKSRIGSSSSSSGGVIRITASAAPTVAKLISSASKLCYLCQKGSALLGSGSTSTSLDQNQLLIQCSSCPRASHPNCLELNPQLVDWECIRAYDWQCMECKRCSGCQRTQDEDKMMFCDRCDRGFHTYCVGLDDVPSGSWLCTECVSWQDKVRGLSEKFNERKVVSETPAKVLLQSPSVLSPSVQHQLKSKLMTSSGRVSVKRLSTNQLLDDSLIKRGKLTYSIIAKMEIFLKKQQNSY